MVRYCPRIRLQKALCYVEQDLDLITVATAMAEDNSQTIRTWMDSNKFRLATADDAANFAELPEREYQMLVVSPSFLFEPVTSLRFCQLQSR